MRAQKGAPMINQLAGYFDQMAAIIRRIEDKEIFREKDFASLLGDKNHQIYFELIGFFPKLIRDNRTAGSLMIRFFPKIDQGQQNGGKPYDK